MILSVCSVVFNSVTPQTAAHQAPLFTGFSRQEYWSGLPFPPAGSLPYPGIKLPFLASPILAGRFFTTAPPRKSAFNFLYKVALKIHCLLQVTACYTLRES